MIQQHACALSARPWLRRPWTTLPRRGLAAALTAAAACTAAQAAGMLPAATEVHGPGVWHVTQPRRFAEDSVLELQIAGIGGAACDPCSPTLVFEQGVSFAGTLRVTLDPGWFVYAGLTYALFSYWSSLPDGRFSRLELPPVPDGLAWNTDSLYTAGTLQLQQPVPEPDTWALWLAGLAASAAVARRIRTA